MAIIGNQMFLSFSRHSLLAYLLKKEKGKRSSSLESRVTSTQTRLEEERKRYAWKGASGSISDSRGFRSYPRGRGAEGKGASTRITRPRFLRNLTEISLAAPLPSYPETKRTFSKRGGGGGRVTCGRGKQLFDSWLEHLSREIYVVRGGGGGGQCSLMVIN